jgi:hypothetical protein
MATPPAVLLTVLEGSAPVTQVAPHSTIASVGWDGNTGSQAAASAATAARHKLRGAGRGILMMVLRRWIWQIVRYGKQQYVEGWSGVACPVGSPPLAWQTPGEYTGAVASLLPSAGPEGNMSMQAGPEASIP